MSKKAKINLLSATIAIFVAAGALIYIFYG